LLNCSARTTTQISSRPRSGALGRYGSSSTHLGFRDWIASCCVWLTPAFEHEGDHAFAARLLGTASGIRKQTGASLDWQEQEFLDEAVGPLQVTLGAEGYGEAFAAGDRTRRGGAGAPQRQSPEPLTQAGVQDGSVQPDCSPAAGAAARVARLAKQTTVARAICAPNFVCL